MKEVKSGRARTEFSGMESFGKSFHPTRKLLVGQPMKESTA